MNSKAKTVAFIGVMTALEFVAMFLETYVFVALIPLAPPCMLSLSVAITLSIYADWKKMFLGGTIMGCCSLVIAAFIGNAVFILPWISVLPRIFIGIVAFGVTAAIKRIFRSSENRFLKNILPYSLGAIFGTLTNTVLVLTMMYAFKFVGTEDIIATFMAINFPLELAGSAIITPVLIGAVKKFKGDKNVSGATQAPNEKDGDGAKEVN